MSIISPTTTLGYTGAPTDSNGLVYLNARYLDPATGTFLTRDPFEGMAESAMSRNPYSYTGGNQVNRMSACYLLLRLKYGNVK